MFSEIGGALRRVPGVLPPTLPPQIRLSKAKKPRPLLVASGDATEVDGLKTKSSAPYLPEQSKKRKRRLLVRLGIKSLGYL